VNLGIHAVVNGSQAAVFWEHESMAILLVLCSGMDSQRDESRLTPTGMPGRIAERSYAALRLPKEFRQRLW
jgi:hypothetical protein